jgi:hypothetical protein
VNQDDSKATSFAPQPTVHMNAAILCCDAVTACVSAAAGAWIITVADDELIWLCRLNLQQPRPKLRAGTPATHRGFFRTIPMHVRAPSADGSPTAGAQGLFLWCSARRRTLCELQPPRRPRQDSKIVSYGAAALDPCPAQ